MKIQQLVHQVIPYDDEYAGSFLVRLSYINGYESPSQMLNNFGYKIYNYSYRAACSNRQIFEKFLENLGIDYLVSALSFEHTSPTKKNVSYRSKNISKSLFRFEMDKFCPQCLEKKGYWRKIWLLKPITICLKHNIDLISQCPYCSQQLAINRKMIYECNTCNLDIRKFLVNSTCFNNFSNNNWFVNELNFSSDKFFEKFQLIWNVFENYYNNLNLKCDYANILNMCYLLYNDKDNFIRIMVNIVNENSFLNHPRIQLVPLLTSVREIEVLGNIIYSKAFMPKIKSTNHIKQDLTFKAVCKIMSISFITLKTYLKENIISDDVFSNKEANKFLSERIEILLLGKRPQKVNSFISFHDLPIVEESFLDSDGIAKLLNISQPNAQKILKIPDLKITKRYFIGSYKFCIKEDDLMIFDKKYICLSALAKNLDINPTNLKEKLSFINIKPASIGMGIISIYLREDVNHLTKEIIEKILNYPTRAGRKSKEFQKTKDYLTLSEAAKKLNIKPLQLARLIREGYIKVDDINCRPYKIKSLHLMKFIREIKNPDFVVLDEALKQLNCPINWISEYWVKTGFLQIRSYIFWFFVDKRALQKIIELKEIYFTGGEASTYLEMPHSHITNLVKQKIIEPVYLGNQKKHIRLFKKADVYKLKIT